MREQLSLLDAAAWETRRELKPSREAIANTPAPPKPEPTAPASSPNPAQTQPKPSPNLAQTQTQSQPTLISSPTLEQLHAASRSKDGWARHRDSGDRGHAVQIKNSNGYGVSIGGLYEPWSELWELEVLPSHSTVLVEEAS